METKIDCEKFLDLCWRMLNMKYEEVYGQRNYRYQKPEFTFVLSHEEIMALRLYSSDMPSDKTLFIGIANQTLFGHPFIEQTKTPYLMAIITENKEGTINANQRTNRRTPALAEDRQDTPGGQANH